MNKNPNHNMIRKYVDVGFGPEATDIDLTDEELELERAKAIELWMPAAKAAKLIALREHFKRDWSDTVYHKPSDEFIKAWQR
jgi:hypothetical protein